MSATPATSMSARPPLARLVAVEWRKTLDTRASMWLLIITALGVVGIVLGQGLSATGEDAQAGSIFYSATAIASILLPILAILLVTSEWSQRAGLITFALVPQRPRVILAKYLATIVLIVATCAVCLLLALLGGALGEGASISGTEIGQGSLYVLISVSIGFALGLLFMNSPLAIVLLFAGPIVFGIIGAISTSIGNVTEWLDQSEMQDLVSTTASVDWGKIAVTALFWIGLVGVAGLVRLRQSDID